MVFQMLIIKSEMVVNSICSVLSNKDNALTAHADYWTPYNRDAEYPAVHANVELIIRTIV
jgi:hypothetical protein